MPGELFFNNGSAIAPVWQYFVITEHNYYLSISVAVLFGAGFALCSCAKTEEKKVEGPSPAQQLMPVLPQQKATPDPPKPNEIQEALKRVFKDAVAMDVKRQPNFFSGDFNGDLSPDLAVVLKPVPGRLSQLNEESPPWILKDPLMGEAAETRPLRIQETELLLAVIHGYGPDGWRNPEATQTYLLKNAVGSLGKVYAKDEFVAANRGKKLPRLRGDLIGVMLRGRSGYLYYAEASYSWYDPSTFKGEPERRVVHPGFGAQ